jgi:predicted TIM-barrel fold metal-dependent hydrolase
VEDHGLPVKLGPASNGEYHPGPTSPLVAEAVRRTMAFVDDTVRRSGVSRREFLRSTCAAAATLAAVAACSKEEAAEVGKEPGGTFTVPPEATTDPDAADEALNSDAFVMDVQGHLLEYDLAEPVRSFWGSGFPQAGCGEDDPRACFTTGHFLEEVLVASDTSVVVLSAVPIAGPDGPLTAAVMDEARRQADRLCGDGRVLMQGHVTPTAEPVEAAIEAMTAAADRYPIRAWKVYTHAAGPGWWLDDHEPGAPQVGARFVEHGLSLGIPIVSVHKGFSGGSRFASPVDVGPAAVAHPDARFVTYHSGYEAGQTEGPYDQATRDRGVNRLVASVLDAGLGPGSNVYAELGSTWRSVMGAPDQAAHLLGKLLLHLGEDNVVWGTDSIWYGSPQDQIQAFRAFEISEELQERHGYPALTPEVKAKVLGLNAARLYDVDPVTVPRCDLDAAERAELRLTLPGTTSTYGPRGAAEIRAHMAHQWGAVAT